MSDPDIYRRLTALEKWRDNMASVEKARPVYALYNTNAAQSIPDNTLTIVDFEDVISDPDSLVTTGAAWVFTCPIAGLYHVTAAIMFAATTTWAPGTEAGSLFVYLNGAISVRADRKDNFTNVASQQMQLSGSCDVVCAAGDTINIRVVQNSGAALALNNTSTINYVNIFRVN